jgi:opacity protein-like surface antigen
MKKIVFFIILSGIFYQVSAQKDTVRNSISINSGIVIPFSEFAGNSLKDGGGFAGNGMNIRIDYIHYLNRHLGIDLSVGYTNILFDVQKCTDAYNAALQQTEGVEVRVDGNYQIYKGSLGLVARAPQVLHTTFFAKASLGSSLNVLPGISADDDWVLARIKQDECGYMTYEAGLGCNHYFKQWGISVEYSRLKAKPFLPDNAFHISNVLEMSFQTINVGVLYKF